MLKLATADNKSFNIAESPDSPYTIDLIDFIKNQYPKAQFFFVIGSDIVEEFQSWYKYEEVIESIKIIIAARPGYALPKAAGIFKSADIVKIPQYDISSHDIRDRVKSRMSIKYMVPEAVERYICQKGLYVEK